MKAEKRVVSHLGGKQKWNLASASQTGHLQEVKKILRSNPDLSDTVWENCCSANFCRQLQSNGIPLTNWSGLSLVIPDKEVTDLLHLSGMSPVNSVSLIKRMIRDGSPDGWKVEKLQELEARLAMWKSDVLTELQNVANLPHDVAKSVCEWLG